MELALSLLTLLYADLRFNHEELLNAVCKWLIKIFLIILGWFMFPIIRIKALKKLRSCPPITDKILFLSATELARRIRRRELTSEEVILTYIKRCKEVNPVINAIVQDRFDAAIIDAREVDRLLDSGLENHDVIEQKMPLLGVPVTVKESIAVQGMSHSSGLKRSNSLIPTHDSDAVTRVRKAGGIPILVSNTPEMCMCWETYNNVTGTTWNPYNTNRTAGGSSGGEAALLGSAASVVSISSDIGGSARLPALFCGVFGHKPTPEWISCDGHMPDCDDAAWTSFFSIGPMVRYSEDLPMMLRILCQSNVDVSRLDKEVQLSDVKFYFMETDNSLVTNKVDDEILNGIRKFASHLENVKGVKVQQADVKEMKYAFEAAVSMLLRLDGVDTIYKKGSNPRDLLGDNGVLIYPGFTTAAHYPYEIFPKICDVAYMMIFNSIGLPVTQCPIGLNKNGLPIGFQVIGNVGKDHLTIAVAHEIERTFGGWQEPPSAIKSV